MSILRLPAVIAFTVLFIVKLVSAQQPPSVTSPLAPAPLTKEQIENPPARELKFEQSSEAFLRPLNRPHPALVEQKFVAVVPFVVSPVEGRSSAAVERSSKLYDLQTLGGSGTYFLSPDTNTWLSKPQLSEAFERLLGHVPEQLLSQAERDFFRSAEVDIGFVMLSNNVRDSSRASDRERRVPAAAPKDAKTVQVFWILGKTVAECEQRSRALVTILDQGFSRPLQLELLQMRNDQAEYIAKRQQEYLQMKESLPGLKKSLEDYADLSNDMLTGLRLQQREAEIKLAGTKARLAAAEKLLTKAREDGASPARTLPLEEARFTAEIEIADLEARQAKALELVTKVSTRIDLTTRIESDEKSMPRRYETLAAYLGRVQQIDRDLLRHGPLPLLDGKIVIRPVEWTTP